MYWNWVKSCSVSGIYYTSRLFYSKIIGTFSTFTFSTFKFFFMSIIFLCTCFSTGSRPIYIYFMTPVDILKFSFSSRNFAWISFLATSCILFYRISLLVAYLFKDSICRMRSSFEISFCFSLSSKNFTVSFKLNNFLWESSGVIFRNYSIIY